MTTPAKTFFKSKFGRIFKKRNRRPDGTFVDHTMWTVRFKGKDYATGETDPKKAERFLAARHGEVDSKPASWRKGEPEPKQEATPILMKELFDDLAKDGARKGNRSSRGNEGMVDLHLRPFFEDIDASKLTTKMFEAYVDQRLVEKAARASINRELASLKRALNLASKSEPYKILRYPKITMLKGLKTRKGFISHEQYINLKSCLPEHLVPVAVAAYHIGTRRGELLQVELRDVEMDAIPQPQFRLYPDATKSGEGRVIPIYGEMVEVFRGQIEMTRRDFPGCTWLFHDRGERLLTFYKAWATATELAGLPGLLLHDFRRTTVRNLTRSGTQRKVAMGITGHKTEAVFERYNIVEDTDLREAAAKMEAYLKAQPVPKTSLVS